MKQSNFAQANFVWVQDTQNVGILCRRSGPCDEDPVEATLFFTSVLVDHSTMPYKKPAR